MKSEIKFISIIALLTILVVGGGLYISAKNGGETGIPKPVVKIENLIGVGSPVMENGMQYLAKDTIISTSSVTIVEFADYACPACSVIYPEIEKLLKENPKVKYVYRTVPIHAQSKDEARLVYASIAQGKFKEFSSLVFKNQNEWNGAGKDFKPFFEKYAKEIGIDFALLQEEAKKPSYLSTIEADEKDAQTLNVFATPTVIFVGPNGSTYIQGAVPASDMQKLIDSIK